jgi:phosphatidylserine/phosphatidylglycerophosphate/cardiolipin synthase-like enzyme
LFNEWKGGGGVAYLNLSSDLTKHLIKQKEKHPDLKIDFITDPINTIYGGSFNQNIEELRKGGVNVVITELRPLRDSNLGYSPFSRIFLQWWGNNTNKGWLPHPFSLEASKVSLRSYFRFLNFKANHRKVFLADSKDGFISIILSANPHDSSAKHSNVALKIVDDSFAKEVYKSEQAVAKMSEASLQEVKIESSLDEIDKNYLEVQLLTEGKIKQSTLENIKQTQLGDKIKMAMFYLSDIDIVKSLTSASKRGVEIMLVLDPNKDAFGYEKNGIPNRQVASQLIDKSGDKIQIRWYNTKGEQFHTKLIIFEKKEEKNVFILGSANLTRRNIADYNLETNVLLRVDSNNSLSGDFIDYFNRIWLNEDGFYTVDYQEYKDDSSFKKIIYKFQEITGISSF